MAPTEGSTVTGTDTASKKVSTITAASNLWREEMNGAMKMNRDKLLRMERNHTQMMAVMQQMSDEIFFQVQIEMRDSSQSNRALLQANGEAVSQVTNPVRWNTNETEKIREKMTLLSTIKKHQ